MSCPDHLSKGAVSEFWELNLGATRDSRLRILQDLFDDSIEAREAANQLVQISLATDNLGLTFTLIIYNAKEHAHHQDRLVQVLSHMARLPDSITTPDIHDSESNEEQIVWTTMPGLGMAMNSEWNSYTIPIEPPSAREKEIERFIGINRFCARLMETNQSAFNFSLFALWTLRTALEIPSLQLDVAHTAPEAFVPAASEWLLCIGDRMVCWDEQFDYGGNKGDPGRSGALIPGKHGFDRERWEFWGRRMNELSRGAEKFGEEVRIAARRAYQRMEEIERDERWKRATGDVRPDRVGLGRQRESKN